MDDLSFSLRGLNRRLSAGANCERQLVDRSCGRSQHEPSYIYSFLPPFCSRFFNHSCTIRQKTLNKTTVNGIFKRRSGTREEIKPSRAAVPGRDVSANR